MAIPSVNLFANQPGGGLVTALRGINSLADEMNKKQYNALKTAYGHITIPAQAASQIAYANAVAPQFIAKLLGNEDVVANLGSNRSKNALNFALNSVAGNNTANSFLDRIFGRGTQPSKSNQLFDGLKNAIGLGNSQSQPLPQTGQLSPQGANLELTTGNSRNYAPPNQNAYAELPANAGDLVNNNPAMEAYETWNNTPYGKKQIDKEARGEKADIPDEKQVVNWYNNLKSNNEPSWAEKAGEFSGLKKEEEELGKYRAKNIDRIGQQQETLSNTGVVLDRLIDGFTSPEIIAMREEIPFFQDTQLKALTKVGNPQQREMLGDLVASIESFKAATVNTFKGQTLKREFEFADKLKPTENDTVYTAIGKLHALKSLKEVAYQKNLLINKYIKQDKMDLTDAIDRANKKIDVKKIEKEVKEYTSPLHRLKNPKTGQIIYVPTARAKELGAIK